ncbi:hypothetical protein BKA64DRAFT_22986 [Cadophora sp. MPI-SDFR-AT-0126]|nr:hypothetical protein BKA64DRAFT_22986 [Leotiomycetes sp. MPI-SDFR-AT-0126]
MSTQSAIHWPAEFLPGTTDNFVSNEVIASSLSASQIWSLLADISKWSSYYNNVSSITPPSSGPHLKKGDTFKFSTFGFPVLTCIVEESTSPETGKAGRIAWSAKLEAGEDSVSVYHAWLVEDLEGGRLRILTQESQNGKPAKELAGLKPNKMLLGHQDWCEGLVRAARGEEMGSGEQTNLKAAGMGSYGRDLRGVLERRKGRLETGFWG